MNIPKDILINSVFSLITTKEDRRNSMMVNKYWLELCRRIFYPQKTMEYHTYQNNRKIVGEILRDTKADPTLNGCKLIFHCMDENYSEILTNFIRYNEKVSLLCGDVLIVHACQYGKIDLAKELLRDENVDPSIRECTSLILASNNGHYDIVELLLKDNRIDPSCRNNKSLFFASKNRHFGIVKKLLRDKRVDPLGKNTWVVKITDGFSPFQIIKELQKYVESLHKFEVDWEVQEAINYWCSEISREIIEHEKKFTNISKLETLVSIHIVKKESLLEFLENEELLLSSSYDNIMKGVERYGFRKVSEGVFNNIGFSFFQNGGEYKV